MLHVDITVRLASDTECRVKIKNAQLVHIIINLHVIDTFGVQINYILFMII